MVNKMMAMLMLGLCDGDDDDDDDDDDVDDVTSLHMTSCGGDGHDDDTTLQMTTLETVTLLRMEVVAKTNDCDDAGDDDSDYNDNDAEITTIETVHLSSTKATEWWPSVVLTRFD